MISIPLDKLDYYAELIFSCMNQVEQTEESSQSDFKYAYKKWRKVAMAASEDIKKEKIDDLQDELLLIDIKYGNKNDKVLKKIENGKDKNGQSIMIVEFNAEIEPVVTKEKRTLIKKFNAEQKAIMIEFEPYIYNNLERIKTFDLFTVEELAGIFFPEGV